MPPRLPPNRPQTGNASAPSRRQSLGGGCTAWPPQGWGAAAAAAVAGPAFGWAPAPRLTALTPGVAAALTAAAEQWAAGAVASGRGLPAECWRGVQLLEVGEVDAACEAAGGSSSNSGSSSGAVETLLLRFTPTFTCSSIHFTTLRGSRMEVRRTLFVALDLPPAGKGGSSKGSSSGGGRPLAIVPHRVTYPMTLGR